jgi:hypothetical protein
LAAAGFGAGIDRIAGDGRLTTHCDGCWCHNVSRTQQTGDRPLRTFVTTAAKVCFDEGFSMRATARGFGAGLTLARVDKPLKEEAVGC